MKTGHPEAMSPVHRLSQEKEMKKVIVMSLVLVAAGMAMAAEGKLGTDVDIAWASKFIWRGLDLGDNKATFQPSVNFDLWGSGFSTKITGHWLGGPTNGAEAALPTEALLYSLTYANSLQKGDAMQVDYNLTYTYWDFYATGSEVMDFQDLAATVAFPKLCPAGFVPSYTLAYSWSGRPGPTPGVFGQSSDGPAGFVHIIGLDYTVKVGDQPLNFSADAVYNDGTYGDNVDHDWSNIVWGLSTSFKCPFTGAKFTPGIYYQTSMDDSVNKNDEFWTTLSYKLSF
jgi:hypothetical protein